MKIVERFIDGEIYRIISVGRFSAAGGRLSDEVKAYLGEKNILAKWSVHKNFGAFLEGIPALENEAKRLFETEKVGVLVFVNDSEPDTGLDKVSVKKGDIIEIAYVGEGPEAGERSKHDFFESSGKRHYSSVYRRDNEWRKPKGAK
jgi:hypothetical protein